MQYTVFNGSSTYVPVYRTYWMGWHQRTTRQSSSNRQELWCRQWFVMMTDSMRSQILASLRTLQGTDLINTPLIMQRGCSCVDLDTS